MNRRSDIQDFLITLPKLNRWTSLLNAINDDRMDSTSLQSIWSSVFRQSPGRLPIPMDACVLLPSQYVTALTKSQHDISRSSYLPSEGTLLIKNARLMVTLYQAELRHRIRQRMVGHLVRSYEGCVRYSHMIEQNAFSGNLVTDASKRQFVESRFISRARRLLKKLRTVPSRDRSSVGSLPSPDSSVASFTFSSSGSSSTGSPPSSHSSVGSTSPLPGNLVRRQPRIQVSSLLADPYTRTYHLEVVQQPQKTAEFGNSILSRLPISPTIVARLTVRDSSGNSVVPEAELPFLIAHLSLYSGDGATALDMGSSIGRNRSPPLLYGNLVSSIDQLEDLQGNMGLFFIFPDVSIRWRGQFQLGISVMRIAKTEPSGGMSIADQGTLLAEAKTRPFDVVPYREYTAIPRTRLTNAFLRQGARMFTQTTYNV